jgi:hypothetical protein
MPPIINIHSEVDGLTILVGLAAIPFRMWLRVRNGKPMWSAGKATVDFLNGATIVPFTLLLISAFYQPAFNALVQTSMLSVGLAGGVGLLFISGELLDTT